MYIFILHFVRSLNLKYYTVHFIYNALKPKWGMLHISAGKRTETEVLLSLQCFET